MQKLMGEQAGDPVKRSGAGREMPQFRRKEGKLLPAQDPRQLQAKHEHHCQHERVIDPRALDADQGVAVMQDKHARGRPPGRAEAVTSDVDILSVRASADQSASLGRRAANARYGDAAAVSRSLMPAWAAATFISAEDIAYSAPATRPRAIAILVSSPWLRVAAKA